MKTNLARILLILGLPFAATGCIFFQSVPSELGAVELVRVSSKSVEVRAVTIERDKAKGGYIVRGYVYRRPHIETTARTRLHVRFLSSTRDLLREEVIGFEPVEIKEDKARGEPEPYGTYVLHLSDFPPHIAEVEITAEDDGP